MESIDFDEASRDWRENKVQVGGGMFAYRCAYIHSSSKPCSRTVEGQQFTNPYIQRPDWTPVSGSRSMEFCKQHRIRGPKKRL